MIILGGISKHYKTNGGVTPPTFSVNPTISGTAVVGQTLSVSFTLNNADTVTRKWYRNGVLIFTSTTNNTYTLVSADAGQNIKCTVTATNTAGSVNADSNTLAILATLLDLYPNAAAAYSVRLLRGAYLSSPAIRVRRSSDNAEQNIGFTSSGDLDTTAVATFVGSNSGFIVTWYDQSGNANNATQTTPASQHQIVVSGTITTIGAHVAMNSLALPALLTTSTFAYTHLISVAKIDTYSSIANYVCSAASNTGGCFYGGNLTGINGLGGFDGTNIRSLTGEDLNRHIGWFSMRSSSLFVQRDNGTEANIGSFSSSLNCVQIIGNNLSSNAYFKGKYQEVIFYNTDISSNKSAMITNVNNYYGVY